jgi:CRISPR-associated endonuclease/helicase Cas3
MPNGSAEPCPASGDELSGVFAKSASRSGLGRPELLTAHSAATRDATLAVAARIGAAGVLARYPRFWSWAACAALLHDAGKIARGFQLQLQSAGQSWGERHEVLSLAYADLLTARLPEQDRTLIAAGVAFHHQSLTADDGRGLLEKYPPEADWEGKFGRDTDTLTGKAGPVQVTRARNAALLDWLATELEAPATPRDATNAGECVTTLPFGIHEDNAHGDDGRRLWERARDAFGEVTRAWKHPVEADLGLLAVLLQGAVTLADHAASAHVPFQDHMPLPHCYLARLVSPYRHQEASADADGHLILVAPTGSGKTEAGLAWASRQLAAMPGQPRLVWVLPYRASLNAARDRFRQDLDPAPGDEEPDIGVLHGTTAATLLHDATADDRAPGRADARKARARAGAMRLFEQRVRVATPHQLLRAAIAGPRYSSVLLEQANSMIVLDELHAYDPATFGRICAAMQLWDTLGSRIAVLSATLAPPMIDLITETLGQRVTIHRAPPGTAPARHRLVLDDQPITSPASVDRMAAWLAEGRSVLAVANRVAVAQHVFRALAPAAQGCFPGDPDAALLLHSRFRGCDRADIERRIRNRHPERKPGDPALRGGGLVVATQALEVSLCLDFDRGVTEIAPIEAVAQRAGRVNRRGRHPDGAVEFRVQPTESPLPYLEEAVAAALLALRASPGPEISEEVISRWLEVAYSTPWGQGWAAEARRNRDEFSASFLTFAEPFRDRGEFAAGLAESFDATEVVLRDDLDRYRDLVIGPDGDPLLAAGLLIPIRWTQRARLHAAGRARHDRSLDVWVIEAPYDPDTGLDLAGR